MNRGDTLFEAVRKWVYDTSSSDGLLDPLVIALNQYTSCKVEDDSSFWKHQAEQNANEIAALREALKQERLVRLGYRQLLDCYELAVHAFTEVEQP